MAGSGLAMALGVTLAVGQGQVAPKAGQDQAKSAELPTTPHSRPTATPHSDPPAVDRRLREGTELLDQTGYFKIAGDRVIFSTLDNKMSMVGLENLNLERIARAIADSTDQLEWKVSGTVTEYSGANYFLVERAILRSRAEPREGR